MEMAELYGIRRGISLRISENEILDRERSGERVEEDGLDFHGHAGDERSDMLDACFDDERKSCQHNHQKSDQNPQDDPGDLQTFFAIEFHLRLPFRFRKKPEPF